MGGEPPNGTQQDAQETHGISGAEQNSYLRLQQVSKWDVARRAELCEARGPERDDQAEVLKDCRESGEPAAEDTQNNGAVHDASAVITVDGIDVDVGCVVGCSVAVADLVGVPC